MEKAEFSQYRKKMGKTQKQLAGLLGMSLKAVHSYEQGLRAVPTHIERHLMFLLFNQRKADNQLVPCWDQKDCQQKEECSAWEFQSGHLCWYMCGTLCGGTSESTYQEKLDVCRSCNIFKSLRQWIVSSLKKGDNRTTFSIYKNGYVVKFIRVFV